MRQRREPDQVLRICMTNTTKARINMIPISVSVPTSTTEVADALEYQYEQPQLIHTVGDEMSDCELAG